MKKFSLALLLGLLVGADAHGDEPSNKLPVPSAEKQAASLATVKDLFKNEYAKKSAADAAALAKKLFDTAVETKNEPADRFTMLSESREAAVRAGDVAAAIRAIDQLTSDFAVDPVDLKIKTLTEVSKTATAGDADRALQAMIETIEEAIDADQYQRADQVLAAAKGTVRRTTDKKLTARLDQLSKEITALSKQFEEVRRWVDVLKEHPDDPTANLAVGRFKCGWKGNWDEGLPLLAKASDAKLKAVAVLELKVPAQAADQVQLADLWWDLADLHPEPVKGQLQKRAGHWYARALPELNGFVKSKAEKRLHEVESAAVAGASRTQKAPSFVGLHLIRTGQNGDYLAISEGKKNAGAIAIAWPKRSSDEQEWILERLSGGVYEILNKRSRLVLTVEANSKHAGRAMNQMKWKQVASQLWRIEPLPDGQVKIINVGSGLYLTADGQRLSQEEIREGASQHWRLEPLRK
jgi:hypothetical protein